MLSGIAGFIGRLFGTEKALTGIVEGVSNGLDALVYTDQEKAMDAAQATTEARRMVVEWMAATQGQNLARRLIALSITGVWLSMYLLSVFVSMVAIFVENSAKLQELSLVALDSANEMNGPVMLILAFYFAAPHMGDMTSAIIGRMGKNKI